MILYNITYNIDREVDSEWMEWLEKRYIPGVMSSGCFRNYKVYRLLQAGDEQGINYAIQFFADTLKDLESFLESQAPLLSEELRKKFMNRHVAFMTVLQDTGL